MAYTTRGVDLELEESLTEGRAIEQVKGTHLRLGEVTLQSSRAGKILFY